MFLSLAKSALRPLQSVTRIVSNGLHSCSSHAVEPTALAKPSGPLLTLIRTKVRNYFPRPKEVQRVRRHGWEFRMSTPNGRRIIMRRILRGRFVLSH